MLHSISGQIGPDQGWICQRFVGSCLGIHFSLPEIMLFCATCANLLVISSESGFNKWACNTCPYEFPISKQVRLAAGSIAPDDSTPVDDF